MNLSEVYNINKFLLNFTFDNWLCNFKVLQSKKTVYSHLKFKSSISKTKSLFGGITGGKPRSP